APQPQAAEVAPQPQAAEVAPQPQAAEVAPQPQAAEPKWHTFPNAKTDSAATRKVKASACRNQLVKALAIAKCRKDLGELSSKWTREEVSWVAKFLLTPDQARQLKAVLATEQMELDL
ncbi:MULTISPECIES: hypothetical protein, partial [unclassified Microcoleus]|uniref:hypothetical protein n=1 Tax=unclassified Microcoleus TaxID=2642155 RepID=UPI002FD305A2